MNTSHTQARLRPAQASALRWLFLFALPGLVSAQQKTISPTAAADTNQPVKLEAVSVTGSNIKRTDEENTLPVTIFSVDDIDARDSVTPADLLSAIPEISNIPNNETSTNAVAARGDNANVALRGFGASNTLVLLNGRRMPAHPFNTSSVNVNTLPTFGVQQVEVLRDGASSIYGSDAVAGVVNYVTRKDLHGGEYGVRFGFTEHGGGKDVQGTFGTGTNFAGGKGSILLNLTAYNRDPIFLRQRKESRSADRSSTARAPWNVSGGAYDSLSSNSIWTQYRVGSGVTSGPISYFYPTDGTPTGTPALTTVAPPRSLFADYNEYITGQPRSSRFNLYSRIEYEISPSVQAYADITGYYSASRTNRQPMALSSSDAVVTLSVDNPYNPRGSRFYNALGAANDDGTARLTGAPQPITIAAVLFPDGGAEKIVGSDGSYRLLTGLRGALGNSSWNWDAGLSYGAVRATDSLVNSIRQSFIQQVAQRTDATAWNPFGYTFKVVGNSVVVDKAYANPQSVRDSYTRPLKRYGHNSSAIADVSLTGNIVDLWAGPIAASFGAEWRRETNEDTKDPYAGTNPVDSGLDPQDNDFLTTSAKPNWSGSRKIASAYGEVLLPLTAPRNQLPGLYALQLNVSGRFQNYSDFGSTTKPKYGVSWKPFRSLLLRGSANEGYSAPDLASLYQPTSFSNSAPPGSRDSVRNNILLSAGLTADNQVLSRSYSIANSNLQPETSKGKSAGIAVDVPYVKGLSFTVDYWELEQQSLVGSVGRDTSLDAQLLLQYTQQQLAAGKSIDSINVGSRTNPTDTAGGYVGDPNTLRAPVTAEDRALFARTWAVLPQSQWTAALGQWIGGVSYTINSTGRNFSSGRDYSISYSLPQTRLGQFRFTTRASQFISKYSQNTPTSPINNSVKSLSTPEWKGSATVQWRKKNWSSTLSVAYLDAVRTGATTTQTVYDALNHPDYIRVVTTNGSTSYVEIGDPQWQLNGGISYRFGADSRSWFKGTTIRLGINNLLDATNTRTTSSTGFSGSTGSSIWVGRAYSVDLRRTF